MYDDYEYYDHERQPQVERRVYIIGQPPPTYDLRPPRGDKFKFSPTEIQHLAVAYIVLVICFAVVLSTSLGGLFFGSISIIWLLYVGLPVSLIAVGLGFILHEVAHKFAAQHYGCWSEFRYDGRGLMMALFFSIFLGVVWAAPGATWFSGHVTKKENGIISLAGPSVNMTIAVIIIPLIFIFPLSLATVYLIYSGFIIAFLAVFNLLPISPLDGAKVWKWNPGIYISALIGAIAILAWYWMQMF
jgi:Zn-dependent protease